MYICVCVWMCWGVKIIIMENGIVQLGSDSG